LPVENNLNAASTLQFFAVTYTVAETDGTATILVTRSGNVSMGTTVQFATSDGTAVAGVNYTAAAGQLNYLGAQSLASFAVPVRRDNVVSGPRTVVLTLSNPGAGSALGTPSTATLTITDSDQAPPPGPGPAPTPGGPATVDVIATAQPLGSVSTAAFSVSDGIDTPTEVNFFSITVTAGQRVRFDVVHSSASPDFDGFLRVLDSAGNQVAFSDDGQVPGRAFSRDPSFTFRFAQGGTYFVGMSGFPNYRYNPASGAGAVPGSMGAYGLTIATAAPERDDNDQLREARPLGDLSAPRQVRDFVISAPDDVDLFRFSARRGQRVTIALSRAPGSALAPVLRLFNARGKPLASGSAVLTFRFSAAGNYFLGISGRGNSTYDPRGGNRDRDGSTGAYSLTLTPAGSRARGDRVTARAVQPPGTQLSGLVYFDQSGDGARQSGEVGMTRRLVILDANRNGVRDDGEATAQTTNRGQFLFSGLDAGRMPVFASPAQQFGFPIEKVSGPRTGFYLVVMRPRRPVSNLFFGMSRYLA
jgi:hypothetical protein